MSEEPEEPQDLIKGLSLTPVITSLLKPSADLLGAELRNLIRDKIKDAKEKRRARNLGEHIKNVKRRLDQDYPTRLGAVRESIEQLELFEEWVKGAESVDPEDEILSSMWEDLLCKIAVGEWPTRDLIELMKKLDSHDARILISLRRSYPSELRSTEGLRYRYHRLVSLGLIKQQIYSGTIVPAFMLIMVTISMFAVMSAKFSSYSLWSSMVTPLVIAFFIAYAMAMWVKREKFYHFVLTPLGDKIVSYARTETEPEGAGSITSEHEAKLGQSANPSLKRTPDGAA